MDDMDRLVIREFYMNERTELGKSVIRQLAELLNVDLGDSE